MMKWEKVLLGVVVPLFFVSTVAVSSVPAQAEDRRERVERSDRDHKSDRRRDRRDRRRGGTSTGEAIAIGLGGLILGAILSDGDILDNDRRYYRDNDRDYYRYRNRYDRYDRRYERFCWDEQVVWFDRRGRQRIDYRVRCR